MTDTTVTALRLDGTHAGRIASAWDALTMARTQRDKLRVMRTYGSDELSLIRLAAYGCGTVLPAAATQDRMPPPADWSQSTWCARAMVSLNQESRSSDAYRLYSRHMADFGPFGGIDVVFALAGIWRELAAQEGATL